MCRKIGDDPLESQKSDIVKTPNTSQSIEKPEFMTKRSSMLLAPLWMTNPLKLLYFFDLFRSVTLTFAYVEQNGTNSSSIGLWKKKEFRDKSLLTILLEVC